MNYRNPKLLKLAKESPCQVCGADDGTIVAAHSNQLRDGKGTAIKAHDYRIAYLCHICHDFVDKGIVPDDRSIVYGWGQKTAWEFAHRKTIAWLFDNGHLKVV